MLVWLKILTGIGYNKKTTFYNLEGGVKEYIYRRTIVLSFECFRLNNIQLPFRGKFRLPPDQTG